MLRILEVSDPRHKGPYPKGPRHQMTLAWKVDALAMMEAKGISRADLARHLGVTRGLVTKLFGEQQNSALVPRISEFLGIGMPMEPTRSRTERQERLEAVTGKLSDDQLDAAIMLLESMLK